MAKNLVFAYQSAAVLSGNLLIPKRLDAGDLKGARYLLELPLGGELVNSSIIGPLLPIAISFRTPEEATADPMN